MRRIARAPASQARADARDLRTSPSRSPRHLAPVQVESWADGRFGERKLAAILSAEAGGKSRLMGDDEPSAEVIGAAGWALSRAVFPPARCRSRSADA